jgi:hypothetical protein
MNGARLQIKGGNFKNAFCRGSGFNDFAVGIGNNDSFVSATKTLLHIEHALAKFDAVTRILRVHRYPVLQSSCQFVTNA